VGSNQPLESVSNGQVTSVTQADLSSTTTKAAGGLVNVNIDSTSGGFAQTLGG
jgi:hypothetical protein